MFWKGEYQEGGAFTGMIDIPHSEFDHWRRRVKAGEAKPQLQRASEYSLRLCSGDLTAQIQYQLKITNAARWYKGQKI